MISNNCDPLRSRMYVSHIDKDRILEEIEQKYPALNFYLREPDQIHITEILKYPYVRILKELIKKNFNKLKQPENLLKLLEDLLQQTNTAIILIVNILRFSSEKNEVIIWAQEIREKYSQYLTDSSFLEFYNFSINRKQNPSIDFSLRISFLLHEKLLFFATIESNKDFYIDLLIDKFIKNQNMATDVCQMLIFEKWTSSYDMLYKRLINEFNLTNFNQNLLELQNLMKKIEDLDLILYFKIVNSGHIFIQKEYYESLIAQSVYWDGYLQIIFWKILIYQKINFDFDVPYSTEKNEFEEDAFQILKRL